MLKAFLPTENNLKENIENKASTTFFSFKTGKFPTKDYLQFPKTKQTNYMKRKLQELQG